ncbi:hypothetical protein OHA72_34010 [Dactylosporangium sp. NBC_01737]|uniref:hypothetical protein n=1 Tax=Dactylosporangium sp. NBC_01737 TaxID=2975959 RepID=UPI002E10AC53|nr:hypothetical protein OHA72_34010 [Dactylosporangium sp. NBC_01737]
MGMDVRSFAVPLRADAVQAIRADAELWETASEQPPFCAPWGDEPLPEISRALLAAVPAGAGWVGHFGDRSFQQAEYLLDPVAYRGARTWQERERSTAYRIVAGDEAFAGHARSGQGFPWRCSTAGFLAAAVRRIDGLDVAAARREFSVAEMDDLGLYKVHREEADEHAFARVLAQVRAFAEHCRGVAGSGLDLIVTLY